MDGEASKHNTYMIIYGGLVTTTLVLSFLRVLLFFHATVTASVKLHNNMFDAVIRAPVFFFDTNPTGMVITGSQILDLISVFEPRQISDIVLRVRIVYGD